MNVAIRVALASLVALTIAACGSGGPRSSSSSTGSAGSVGSYFNVTVAVPSNGTVTSSDGQIRCGTGGTACTGRYGWKSQAVLTATPDAGYTLGFWAGDCQLTGTCVLDTSKSGADKYVIAVFGPASVAMHGNFNSPAVHGPAFLDRVAGVPGSLDCTNASCHGATYDGLSIAPSCNACHASAGWSGWLTNCTFCHGERVKVGYAFGSAPAKAAPPDAVAQRLNGSPAPTRSGAHQPHLSGRSASGVVFGRPYPCGTCHVVPTDLSHIGGATARATVVLSGAGQASLPANLGSYSPAAGTCTTYCHGNGKVPGTSPAFEVSGIACDGCHGLPPTSGHPRTSSDLKLCGACHPQTVSSDGTLLADGKHLDGSIQVSGACDACHGFAPATGAHLAHFGLVGPDTSGYGDTRSLGDMFPGATPSGAPAVYAFGCGNCHPLDYGHHLDGVVDVELRDAAAPGGSLKSLASPTAAYDRSTGTCSGVYCHSTGQKAPTYKTTPSWSSATHLACNDCHDNPPRYASGSAGSDTANTHLQMADDGWELGHFSGLPGPWHSSKHGAQYGPGDDSAPITCQSCHFETTDPANTAPGSFYYLDTTGDYQLPGGDPARLTSSTYLNFQCTACHKAGGAPVRSGKVLPLRHVNGKRDIVFDPRSTLPALSWLPAAPNRPTKPYWATAWNAAEFPDTGAWNGTTVSFDLTTANYDPATKTCANVGCHLAENRVVWGTNPVGWATCGNCHSW